MPWFLKIESMKRQVSLVFIILWFCLFSCIPKSNKQSKKTGIELVVLGTVQDAGSPQVGCEKECCKALLKSGLSDRMVVSLGLIDHDRNQQYLFEATPNISMQLAHLQRISNLYQMPNGIFLTHAHIGHYTGLMYFGKEAMNCNKLPVFSMEQMQEFLTMNGPWDQLVKNENIKLITLENEKAKVLDKNLTVTPILVPHRDEYSETVGYIISGNEKSALFIPDIDKWSKWEKDIITEIAKVDYAFIDGTFFSGVEIGHRDIAEIPHPSIEESIQLFQPLSKNERKKIHFIHFNHTNPVLDRRSKEYKTIIKEGYHIAQKNDRFEL